MGIGFSVAPQGRGVCWLLNPATPGLYEDRAYFKERWERPCMCGAAAKYNEETHVA
jgi:hypothetical protein